MSKITINYKLIFFVPETSTSPPLPLQSSPRSARTGPIKAGGRVFVLDHKRWTSPMKEAIDSLLDKYHGQKDMLKLVDQDHAAKVHQSATDPNSLLHPTTKYHITQYIKHLAKPVNTSSSLNTSPEKLLETQKLWHSLTEESETVHVPVVKLPPAIVNPADPVSQPASEKPLTQENGQKIVAYGTCCYISRSSNSSSNKNLDKQKKKSVVWPAKIPLPK